MIRKRIESIIYHYWKALPLKSVMRFTLITTLRLNSSLSNLYSKERNIETIVKHLHTLFATIGFTGNSAQVGVISSYVREFYIM